jgi:hypothetical protein
MLSISVRDLLAAIEEDTRVSDADLFMENMLVVKPLLGTVIPKLNYWSLVRGLITGCTMGRVWSN